MQVMSFFAHGATRCWSAASQSALAHPADLPAPASSCHIVLEPAAADPGLGFSAVAPMAARMAGDLAADPAAQHFLRRWAPELVFLFPDVDAWPACRGATPLAEIAVPPSRRRLHKESEQIFRVTQMLLHLILRWAARHAPQGLHLHFDGLEAVDEHTLRLFARLASGAPFAPRLWISGQARLPAAQAPDMPPDHVLTQPPSRAELRARALARVRRCFGAEPVAGWTEATAAPALPLPAATLGDTAEARAGHQLALALASSQPAAIGGALRLALEASIFTQNHEHALGLLAQAAPWFDTLLPGDRREVLLHVAMLRAFTGDFELALAAATASAEHASGPIEQAECQFFAGLLLVKRLGRTSEGQQQLQQALQVLGDDDDPAAHCERAWLHNILALASVNERDMASARAHCRMALEHAKRAPRSADATHIKINVISNLTVLDEYGRDLDAALQRWSFFEPMLAHASPVFRKHYLFRKAGLLVKAQRLGEALPSLLECHRLAEESADSFYGDVIARAIAGVHWHLGRPDLAADWYCTSLQAKQQLLDDDVADVSFALARCLVHAADANALESRLLEPDGRTWQAPLPETKLNRPFRFTNLH